MVPGSPCLMRAFKSIIAADTVIFYQTSIRGDWLLSGCWADLQELRKGLNVENIKRPYAEGVIVPLLVVLSRDMRDLLRSQL